MAGKLKHAENPRLPGVSLCWVLARFKPAAISCPDLSTGTRGHFYFAWGCFRDFVSRLFRRPPKGISTAGAQR
jgi:hypothetical protein